MQFKRSSISDGDKREESSVKSEWPRGILIDTLEYEFRLRLFLLGLVRECSFLISRRRDSAK